MLKLCISNLVYGEPYTDIFLNLHLKSLLENINSITEFEINYIIFTDGNNIDKIEQHVNIYKLFSHIKFNIITFEDILKYNDRYKIQSIQNSETIKYALNNDCTHIHLACADIYYGPGFWKNLLNKANSGFDAIFGHAIRTSYESIAPLLKQTIISADQLFDISFNNLHPLFTHSNWNNPYFTKIPYNIIWSTEDSIIVRGFSIPGLLFKPSIDKLENIGGCADITLLSMSENPYFSMNWQELPCIEIGMLKSFYPMFSHKPASIPYLLELAKNIGALPNVNRLRNYMLISKKDTKPDLNLIYESETIINEIIKMAD